MCVMTKNIYHYAQMVLVCLDESCIHHSSLKATSILCWCLCMEDHTVKWFGAIFTVLLVLFRLSRILCCIFSDWQHISGEQNVFCFLVLCSKHDSG